MLLRLFHRGRELAMEDMVGSLGIKHLDEISYMKVTEEGDIVEDRVEGFGGTALLGSIGR
jgi:hypothetical protein